MSTIPKNLKYTESHEWILEDTDNNELIIGITEHAQEQLGDIVFVDLPSPDSPHSAGEAIAVIESVKAASDLYAPLDGVITNINEELADNPTLINASPYDEGWLFRMEGDLSSAKNLLTAAQYEALIDA